jgi:hypothetical protein
MPRIRSIKPQFWLDENLGGIPRDARLLYIGLWNLSDDQGVFEWRAAKIKIQLFPYDTDITPKIIEEWLTLLTDTHDISKFNHDGHSFGYIKSFLEHQEIKKPSKWVFAPVPPELKNNNPPAIKSTPPVGGELPTSHPPMGENSDTATPAVPLRSRGEGRRGKGKVLSSKTLSIDQGNTNKNKSLTKAVVYAAATTISLDFFIKKFSYAFGREPDSRERAQVRDLVIEINRAGGAEEQQIHDAFKEAAIHNKCNISYVRGVLLDWLGVPR